jgi:hypothetical protein
MQTSLVKLFKLLLPFLKLLGKALLLPLITDLIKAMQDHAEMKRIGKENERKGDDYVKADTVEVARTTFKDLP